VIERATVLSSGDTILESDLSLDAPSETPGIKALPENLPFGEAKKQIVEEFERKFLLGALRSNDGNVSRTAAAIGMVRQSLQQKIRELNLRSEDWGKPTGSR
jgi:DNA-binding NtrC family response regulator